MISLEDLVVAKESNEKTISENKNIILEKELQNESLEAENRVFDKLIALENSRQENNEESV